MKKINILITSVVLIATTVNAQQDWKKILLEDTASTTYYIQLPELECNICDSITLINPDKQKRGDWILDFRKTRNLVGEWENTKWMYTYGNTTENIYDRNFVPDTLVACVWSKTVESTKCCSKWAWEGLSWIKQKPSTLKQTKSYIEFPKPKRNK